MNFEKLINVFEPVFKKYWDSKWEKNIVKYTMITGEDPRDIRDILDSTCEEIEVLGNTIDGEESNSDRKALECLRYVMANVLYVRDIDNKGRPEFWQKAPETFATKKGDCEDGAILLMKIMEAAGIPSWRRKLCAGDVWDGSSISTETFINQGDIPDICHLQKEINYGIIRKVVQQESKKDNDYLLLQSLKKALSHGIKVTSQKIPEENLFGDSLMVDPLFAKDVMKVIEKNSQFITLTKIEPIILRIIWKFYVEAVIQNTMVKNLILDNLKKDIHLGTKSVEGTAGHAYVIYLNDYFEWMILDWCYWPVECIENFLKRIPHSMLSHKYKTIWFTWNEEFAWAQHNTLIETIGGS